MAWQSTAPKKRMRISLLLLLLLDAAAPPLLSAEHTPPIRSSDFRLMQQLANRIRTGAITGLKMIGASRQLIPESCPHMAADFSNLCRTIREQLMQGAETHYCCCCCLRQLLHCCCCLHGKEDSALPLSISYARFRHSKKLEFMLAALRPDQSGTFLAAQYCLMKHSGSEMCCQLTFCLMQSPSASLSAATMRCHQSEDLRQSVKSTESVGICSMRALMQMPCPPGLVHHGRGSGMSVTADIRTCILRCKAQVQNGMCCHGPYFSCTHARTIPRG